MLLFSKINDMYFGFIGGCPFSKGAIASDMKSIDHEHGVFQMNLSYSCMCHAFLSPNSISLIAWPVGQHNDQFHKMAESVENKLLLVMPSRDEGLDHGGSVLKSQYVFALLHWSHKS